MRTAILIHAQFLQPGTWANVMWGDPQNGRYGIISKGIELAIQKKKTEEVPAIYLCSGIPNVGGREYSPDAYGFLFAHLKELPSFKFEEESIAKQMEYWLRDVIIFDEAAQTTIEEVRNAGPHFWRLEINKVVGVTAPKHAMRALQILLAAKMDDMNYRNIAACAEPSDVDFAEATAKDVAILERAHRHDTPEAARRLDCLGSSVVAILRRGDEEVLNEFMNDQSQLFAHYGIELTW